MHATKSTWRLKVSFLTGRPMRICYEIFSFKNIWTVAKGTAVKISPSIPHKVHDQGETNHSYDQTASVLTSVTMQTQLFWHKTTFKTEVLQHITHSEPLSTDTQQYMWKPGWVDGWVGGEVGGWVSEWVSGVWTHHNRTKIFMLFLCYLTTPYQPRGYLSWRGRISYIGEDGRKPSTRHHLVIRREWHR